MDVLHHLAEGFVNIFQPGNLLAAFIGVLLGTVIGVLPGIGPMGAMALLLSTIANTSPMSAMILFAGIYYGSMYGGSTTAILLNVPGEAASVMTTVDGYRMAQQGRGGAALSIAAIGSFIGGTLSIIGLMLFAPRLAEFALRFGPPEYAALAFAGLVTLSILGGGSSIRGLLMAAIGVALGTVGLDTLSGTLRFSFGITGLSQGFDLVPVVMGLYGLAEAFQVAANPWTQETVKQPRLREMLPNREEARRSVGPILRGSLLGFLMGLIPGPSGVLSTFVSYFLEKKVSRHPERFGKGAIEGVAGPETANNAAAGAAFVPLLALGIPFSPPMALILSALLLNGIIPGPSFIEREPIMFWTVVASMYIGNLMLLILNFPLIGMFTRLLQVPANLLMPIVIVLCLVGAYAVNNSMLDVWVVVGSGIAGYFFRKWRFDPAPLVLGLVLSHTLEDSLRQTLMMSLGDLTIFVHRPVTLVLLLVVGAAILIRLVGAIVRARTWSELAQEP